MAEFRVKCLTYAHSCLRLVHSLISPCCDLPLTATIYHQKAHKHRAPVAPRIPDFSNRVVCSHHTESNALLTALRDRFFVNVSQVSGRLFVFRYRRQGISLELRRQSLDLARQHGCQAVVNSATSPFTRRALTKLGFERVKFLPFTESRLAAAEKVDLSGCGPEDGGALMVCRL